MKLNNISRKIKNRKIIITAGGTIEPIDPIRYIGNFSSGKMGIAVARAFSKYCDNVVLIYANISTAIPENIRSISVKTVKDMYDAVKKHLTKNTILIMSAAVSDYKVKKTFKNKIKKNRRIILELIPTIDILESLSKLKEKQNIFIGFAAETDNIIDNARQKLFKKNLDMIVANPVNNSNNPFGSDFNKVFLIDENRCLELPKMKKTGIAYEILKYICEYII